FIARQRAQMVTGGDALRELTQRRPRQQCVQFRLPEQNQLQQFALVGFEIGEKAQLFEHVGRKILRFIDDENGVAPTRVGCQQKCIQRIEQLLGAGVFLREGDAEFVADRLQQLVRIQLRIDDDGDVDMLRNLLEQTTTDGGLARPDLACEHNETAVIADSINQMPQGRSEEHTSELQSRENLVCR